MSGAVILAVLLARPAADESALSIRVPPGPIEPAASFAVEVTRLRPAGSWAPPLGAWILGAAPARLEELRVESRSGRTREEARLSVLPLATGLQLLVPAPHPVAAPDGALSRLRALDAGVVRVDPSRAGPPPPWLSAGAPKLPAPAPSAGALGVALLVLVASAGFAAVRRSSRARPSASGTRRRADDPLDRTAEALRSWLVARTGRGVSALSTAEIAADGAIRDRLGREVHDEVVAWLDRLDRGRFGRGERVDLVEFEHWMDGIEERER